jgi:adenine-specific DNA-methyltransferase
MNNPLEKFQYLLRELFQFDCADLDFGIYRIMNHKRDVIERFITQDLPKDISTELERGALADQSQAAGELQDVAVQISQTLGQDALDADGNLAATYHATPLGKKYLSLKSKAAGARGRQALEASIFNQLYAFFSRYYQDGDFISKRRYSKRERYAIPYNGEEVYLYWANHDQYYVKTAEHFTDYAFTSRGVTVHFKIQVADVEQNNVKGDKRFFLPRLAEIAWDEAARQLVIPFEYRPLTEQENISYGQKNQQEAILAEALERIPKRLSLKTAAPALAALTAEKRKTGDGQPVTYLEHHLRQYTRRNTSDFFIHKDLKGFLSRELDFYLKNEVLNLDEVEAAGEGRAEGWFQMMRVIKAVGGRIIEFLDQIENFQKMLWEKRKFITETQYCITVGNIAEGFYPEITATEPQWAEWKALFHIDEERAGLFIASKGKNDTRIAFLKAHPTLVLDTRHFDRDFVDRLLASFNDLDKMTDGLLVHSDNWQALNLLVEKYRGKVKCIYIDPPFNTGTNDFLYRNSYLNSSWLAMLRDRIRMGQVMLSSNGSFFCRIDHHGDFWVRQLLDSTFGVSHYQNQMILKRGRETAGTLGKLEIASETLYWFSAGDRPDINEIVVARSIADVQWTAFLMGGERHPRERVFLGKTLVPPDGQHFSLAQAKVDKLLEEHFIRIRCSACGAIYFCADDDASLHRIMKKKENRYKYYDIVPGKIVRGSRAIKKCVECGQDDWRVDYLGAPTVNLSNLWLDIESYAKTTGFFTENSEALLRRVIELASNEGEYVVDFFLGSGTTAAVAHKLKRKWVGVEVGEYFDSVPLLRLKKALAGDGIGISREVGWTGGGAFKYFHLESYEDALNNIAFDDASGQQAMQFDDYLLQYILKWETRKSETLLNVEKLARPFSYKLHIHGNGHTREKAVDIPETFALLLGLHVQTRRIYNDNGQRYLVYRGWIDHRNVAVIWRETESWEKSDFERDRKFVTEQKLAEGADEVFVNGDSLIPNARALEPVFKARMFAPVET